MERDDGRDLEQRSQRIGPQLRRQQRAEHDVGDRQRQRRP